MTLVLWIKIARDLAVFIVPFIILAFNSFIYNFIGPLTLGLDVPEIIKGICALIIIIFPSLLLVTFSSMSSNQKILRILILILFGFPALVVLTIVWSCSGNGTCL
jgi:hypothetical protein